MASGSDASAAIQTSSAARSSQRTAEHDRRRDAGEFRLAHSERNAGKQARRHLDTVADFKRTATPARTLRIGRRSFEAGRLDGPGATRDGHDWRATRAAVSGVQHQLGRQRRSLAHAVHRRDQATTFDPSGRSWICAADRVRERGEPVAGACELETKRDRRSRRAGRESLAHRATVAD